MSTSLSTPTTITTTALCSSKSSLISSDDQWGNIAVLTGTSVAAQIVGTSTRAGKLLGAPVSAMAITFALASFGIPMGLGSNNLPLLSPGGTITARKLQLLSIQLATPLILLGANFNNGSTNDSANDSDSTTTTSLYPLFLGFAVASIGTILGVSLGWICVGNAIQHTCQIFGMNDGLKIASALLAKNIGGGINYVAVCSALKASPEAIATGLCIDNFAALVYFPLSNLIANRYPDPATATVIVATTDTTASSSLSSSVSSVPDDDDDINDDSTDISLSLKTSSTISGNNDNNSVMTVESISIAIFAACGLLWLGDLVANSNIINSPSSQIPIVTLLSVLVASGILIKPIHFIQKQRKRKRTKQIRKREVDGSDGRRRRWSLLSILGKTKNNDDHGTSNANHNHNNTINNTFNINLLRNTCDTLGTVCLYLFFATAGAPGMRVAHSMKSAIWPLSLFSLCLYSVHGMVLYSSYKLFGIKEKQQIQQQKTRSSTAVSSSSSSSSIGSSNNNNHNNNSSWRDAFSPQRLLIASSSAIGGPATSVALARSVQWESLIVPALLIGNIGYAIATFVGIAFYYCFAAVTIA
mmetsp:Transcript_20276/g.21724  ORF Transcript_20276/g.21724 Transcript_20276/m.21724 type:complete len:585 (-) Transcript_20276:191-1945(-)